MRYHYTTIRAAKKNFFKVIIRSAAENVQGLDPSHIAGGNIKWYGHFGKEFGSFLKTQHTLTIQSRDLTAWHASQSNESTCTQNTYALGIHSKVVKAGIQNNICTPMFRGALFTVAKRSVDR